jgi:hypothetical protein
MAHPLTQHLDHKAIYNYTIHPVNDGCSLEAATKIIRQDTGRSKTMMKQQYCVNGRHPKRQQEACKLSKLQKSQLVSVFEVYCLMDEAQLV